MLRRTALCTLTLALLTGCNDCGEIDGFIARGEFDPPIYDLGPVADGATCEFSLNLVNGGQRDLEVQQGTRIEQDGEQFEFLRVPELIGIGSESEVRMSYTAGGTLDQRQTAVVVMQTNADDNDGEISATVTAVPTNETAAIGRTECDGVSPCESVSFGPVQVDDPQVPIAERQGRTLSVRLVNDGNAEMEVLLAAINNGNPDFVVSGVRRGSVLVELPTTLAPGREGPCGAPLDTEENVLTVDVFYAPTSLGADTDELTLVTDAVEGASITVALDGLGSDIGILPTPDIANFGAVGEGSTESQVINISNLGTGEAAVNNSCIDLGGDGTCDGECTGGDPALDGALSCVVTKSNGDREGKGFLLAPTDASAGGDDERNIEITWSPVAGNATIPQGTVLRLETNLLNDLVYEVPIVGGSTGILTVDSSGLCGEQVCVPAEGTPGDVTDWTGEIDIVLENTGDASLDVTSFEWEGPETIADDYALFDSADVAIDLAAPGLSLAPGASVEITVDYANNDASGADFINLVVNHTGAGGRAVIPLQVTAPQP